MFNKEEFNKNADAGNEINIPEVLLYINSFETVIIWGAGNLGTALGKSLVDKGVKISGYWDQRYEEVRDRNGIAVYESFGQEPSHNKDNTLIICGIANGTHSHLGQEEYLNGLGYKHHILGMPLYEGIVCLMRKGNDLDVEQCTGTSICNFNTCKKYMNILDHNENQKNKNIIQVLEFIVSRKCTLDCLECGQRVGRIKREQPQKYVVYSLDQMKRDVDIVMENVDVVGTFSVIGGEPFTNPDLDKFIQHCLTKKNVAIISITTNGVCKMTKKMLLNMKNPRVKINFSNYTESLSSEQKKLFEKNVALVQECGLNCNVATPVWGRVIDIVEVNPDIEENYYVETKGRCQFGPSVSNGTFFACPTTEMNDKLGEIDVSGDQISLEETDHMRERIHELLNRKCYEACKHRCGNQLYGEQVNPGEQRVEA